MAALTTRLHELAQTTAAAPADPQERVRAEIAAWFGPGERDAVYRRLRTAALDAPEHQRSDVYIGIVRRTAGALDLLDSVLADAARDWRRYAGS
ncbi:MAG: hypothetical protein ACREVL_04380 [Solimonas sp.]